MAILLSKWRVGAHTIFVIPEVGLLLNQGGTDTVVDRSVPVDALCLCFVKLLLALGLPPVSQGPDRIHPAFLRFVVRQHGFLKAVAQDRHKCVIPVDRDPHRRLATLEFY